MTSLKQKKPGSRWINPFQVYSNCTPDSKMSFNGPSIHTLQLSMQNLPLSNSTHGVFTLRCLGVFQSASSLTCSEKHRDGHFLCSAS